MSVSASLDGVSRNPKSALPTVYAAWLGVSLAPVVMLVKNTAVMTMSAQTIVAILRPETVLIYT